MSLSQSIKDRDLNLLKKTVEKATKKYNAGKPEDELIDTVFGSIPTSAIFDEDTRWQVISSAYVQILNDVSKIPDNHDKELETAKLIATNAVLRNITESNTDKDSLL